MLAQELGSVYKPTTTSSLGHKPAYNAMHASHTAPSGMQTEYTFQSKEEQATDRSAQC